MVHKHYYIPEIISLVQNFALFRNCSRDEIRQILTDSCWRIRHYKAGEMLLSAAQSVNSLIVVLSGRVAEYGPGTEEGKTHLVRYLNPGDEYGTALVLCEKSVELLYLKADIESDLLFLDLSIISEWVKTYKYPPFIVGMFTSLSDKYRFGIWKISLLSTHETCARIMHYFHSLSSSNSAKSILVNCAKLAEEICVNRTSLYRALSKLEAEGRITRVGSGFRLSE